MSKISKALEVTLAQNSDFFRQFARNGRWGTCGDCPRSTLQEAFPELCRNTDRFDHHLSAYGLAELWTIRLVRNTEAETLHNETNQSTTPVHGDTPGS